MAGPRKKTPASAGYPRVQTTKSSKLRLEASSQREFDKLRVRAKRADGGAKLWATVALPHDMSLAVVRVTTTKQICFGEDGSRTDGMPVETEELVGSLGFKKGAILNVHLPPPSQGHGREKPSTRREYISDCILLDGTVGQVTFMIDGGVQFVQTASRSRSTKPLAS